MPFRQEIPFRPALARDGAKSHASFGSTRGLGRRAGRSGSRVGAEPRSAAAPSAPYIAGMSEPELSDEETRTLIDYARRKVAAER
jgi:hypothetical protein